MSLVAITTGAMDFSPGKNQFEVGTRLDDFRIDRLPKTRPACATIKFMFGRVGGKITAGAVIDAGVLVVVEMVCECTLGRLVSQYLIGFWCQKLFPLLIGFHNLGNRSDLNL